MKQCVIVCLLILLISGLLSGETFYSSGSDGSLEWKNEMTEESADTLSKSLIRYLKKKGESESVIKFMRLRNKTSVHIDTSMVMNKMMKLLADKGISITADNAGSHSGLIKKDAAASLKKTPGYYLYGDIRENIQYKEKNTHQLLVVTLKLKRSSTGFIEWVDQVKFFRIGKRSKISF